MIKRLKCYSLFRPLFMIVAVLAVAAAAAVIPAVAGGHARAQGVPGKSWNFERFDSSITVNGDGSLSVVETQVVNFYGSFSFLNRDLTTSRARFDDGRSYGSVRYRNIEVFDLEGRPWKEHKVESIEGGTRVRIEFSATDQQMGWIVKYRMTGAVIYAKDYDRLYYNTVSDHRDVSIKESRTEVKLPPGTDMSKVRLTQYPDKYAPPSSLDAGREGDVLVWRATGVAPRSTLTIDVAFPKGLVKVPLVYRAGFGRVITILAVLLAVGVTAFMAFNWHRKGRDVSAPELDVVRYQPPADLKPAEVGFLVREGSDTGDLTATIVDLAIRGKLVINEEQGTGLLKRAKFSFQRREAPGDDVTDFERELLDGLFRGRERVTEDDLKNNFYTRVPAIETKVKEAVLGKGLFDGDPAGVRSRYYTLAAIPLALIVGIIVLPVWFDIGHLYAFIPALAVCGLAVAGFGHYMPRRTARGSQERSYVQGFKEYMTTAEGEEMKFMTAENFQENLPYAMVLGVADKWAVKFKDIYTSPPEWYRGQYAGAFSTVVIADSLARMESSVGSTLTSRPKSEGGGSGGGFGGGSSGGGFGGGGSSAG